MARLSTSPLGATLTAADFAAKPAAHPLKTKHRARRAPAPDPGADEARPTHCAACSGEHTNAIEKLTRKGAAKRWEPLCSHCQLMFGHPALMRGSTNLSPSEALARLQSVQDKGYFIVLRQLVLATTDGAIVIVEPGDIFPMRFMAANPTDEPGTVSKERTKRLFTLPIQIGRYQTVLYPHEFDGIGLDRVMAMRRAGEISETFISADDTTGHFTPKPELVEMIKAAFGALVGV